MNDDPIAYFITWTCYGTYLPGDERGWTKWHKGDQLPQPLLEDWCRDHMAESAVLLDITQREIVNKVVREHCGIRGWKLHAVNCRSNHCHVVVTAVDYDGEQVRDQLKSWGKRRLKEHQRTLEAEGRKPSGEVREHWWTRKGSVRKLFDEESLEAAIQYTNEAQDRGGSKANYE
ncbi:MAG: transposase [Planctomycetota bacterium]